MDLSLQQKLDFLTKGLSLNIKGSYNSGYTHRKNRYKEIPYYTAHRDPETNELFFRKFREESQLYFEESTDRGRNWYLEGSLNYDRKFGKHQVGALILYNQWRDQYPDPAQFDYVSIPRGYVGLVGRATYNFDNRYMVDFNVGYNGSENFAPGHRYGIFPAFSAGWILSEEKFMKNQTIFDQLKLRAGFGIVGNQNIDDFAYLSLYNVSYTGTSDTGYTNSFVSNGRRGTPDISWEKQKQWNLGVDMAFLQNRVRLSVDAFLIKNKDLLMSHSLPTTTGFSSTIENIGAIENKGLEFALNANLVRAKDFEWNFAATLSMDKNKVTQLYGDNDVVYNVDSDRNIQKEGNLFLGESRNTIYIWKTGGIAQEIDMDRLNKINWNGYNVNPGDLYPLDYDNNGQIDQNDRVVIGSTDPKFYGGFSTDFSWKGLSLNAVFSYSYGAKKLSPWYETLIGSTGSGVASTDLLDRWTPENTDAEFPRVLAGFDYNHYGASSMDFSVQKASFLRLSALTLAYTFPTKVINALKLTNLRVYATGSNLFCLTNYNGYDPETGDWYPPTRMYTFGLNLTF